ncbi:MAG: metallophosphoesterase [Dysgonamonadaceae bacterium]
MKKYLCSFFLLILFSCSVNKNIQIQSKIDYESTTSSEYITLVKIANTNIKPTRILQITDSHITFAGPEDYEYTQYSSRMAAAYENGEHYKTGKPISRIEAFSAILKEAKQLNVDLILLTGDILNYPSKRAVQFLIEELNNCGIPYLYIAGNHDWHLEGMSGLSYNLREKWRKDILLPLYQGENPSHYARQINGINFLMIDNSTYQITSEQLKFISKQMKLGLPIVVGMHIPVSIDGQLYGIGNRSWGASTDKGYEIERRERWPAEGHNQETYDFVKLLLNYPISIVMCGHIHIFKNERKEGFMQFTTPMGRYGYYRVIDIMPAK